MAKGGGPRGGVEVGSTLQLIRVGRYSEERTRETEALRCLACNLLSMLTETELWMLLLYTIESWKSCKVQKVWQFQVKTDNSAAWL